MNPDSSRASPTTSSTTRSSMDLPQAWNGVIARYRTRLPVTDKTPIVTLLEGNTPLLPAPSLARQAGLPPDSLHLKFEGSNPTGSFKDRGMTLAVSKAVEDRAAGILCASTGNTAASAAAYAARAGLRCLVLLPHGLVAAGKLLQALMHGAEVIGIRGNFDEALALAREAEKELGLTLVNSLNPHRIAGQKTAAFEILEVLGRPPDFQFMPVGNAGNITAYWKGYREACGPSGLVLPRMMGFQASGADPLVRGKPIGHPKTVASAIRIGRPASWESALAAKTESGGTIDRVTDREILTAYRILARTEGVFCEPSSAAAAAGLLRYARRGFFSEMAQRPLRIACILTGHGLKDPDTALKCSPAWKTVPPTLAAIRRVLRPARPQHRPRG